VNRTVNPPSRWLLFAVLVAVCLLLARDDAASVVPDQLHFMPPHPALVEMLQRENLALPDLSAKHSQGIDAPQNVLHPPSGDFNLLVVLVDFDDNQAIVYPQDFDNLFFNTFNYDSVADYYDEISAGSLSLNAVDMPSEVDWQRAPKNYNPNCPDMGGYVNADCQTGTSDDFGWGAYPLNLQGIVADIVPLIDDEIDFSEYDNDGDGFVDGVVFVHAGPGAEVTGSPVDIWSAAWDMSAGNGPGPVLTGDGVYVDEFVFGPEFLVNAGDITIGVFAHELGHSLFGLPDLYDLDQSSYGVGDWSLMSYGAWNGSLMFVPGLGWVSNGDSPAWPDAWSRIRMGFESPQVITENIAGFDFLPVESNPGNVVKLWTPNLGDQEYFLAEYRDKLGYDADLPGRGLLIWHVDETKWNRWELNLAECDSSPCCECRDAHPLLALEQADGDHDLENPAPIGNMGDGSDPFPISGNNSFKFHTDPNYPESGSYYASTCPADSCIAVDNINDDNSPDFISADLNVVCLEQGACVNVLPDRQLGWGEAGESVTYNAMVQNCGNADDTLTLSYEGAWLAELFDIESGEPITQMEALPGQGWTVGVTVTTPVDALWNDTDVLNLTVSSANPLGISSTVRITTTVPYRTLLVDDDRGAPDVEGAYVDALLGTGFDFDLWDTQTRGSPDEATLAAHSAVVWFTGTPISNTLTPHDELALSSYLQDGSGFFFSSQEYLTDTLRNYFGRQYLRVSTFVDNTGTQEVAGVPGNPLSDGLGPYTMSLTTTHSDQITPLSMTLSAFMDEAGKTNAITYDPGNWRTLFLGWPFEHLAATDGEELMASALNWMDVKPRPQVGFRIDNYPVCEGETITFTNTSSNASEYLWSFGDGITSTLTNTLHVYSVPMTATVTLTGTNCCGYATMTETINVIDAPQVSFSPTAPIIYVHQPVGFTILNSDAEGLSYTWDFGDGTGASNEANPTHKFSESGWYTVTLASSDDQCTGVTSMNIYVNPLIYLPLTLKEPDSNAMGADLWQGSARFALATFSAISLGLIVRRPFRRR
jgi:M6 family metalloprotease-like protein